MSGAALSFVFVLAAFGVLVVIDLVAQARERLRLHRREQLLQNLRRLRRELWRNRLR